MELEIVQYLDENGDSNEKALNELLQQDFLRMYRQMVLTRLWNDKALNLQRQGRLGTLPSVKGQEAANIGMALAMEESDWFVPSFREAGTLITLGIPMKNLFLFWGGDERGGKIPDHLKIIPQSIIVGGHFAHAVGIGMAAKYKKENSAVLCCSGDGSTSQGDFHESMNMASLFNVPVVFAIQNNQYAISVPFHRQSASKTIAERAAAYAMDGLRVDGNDVFAVYLTLKKYLARAREEFKPSLIELVTYRMGDHTTADDASRYRKPEEVEYWAKRDPLDRMRLFMQKASLWDEAKEHELIHELTQSVEQAVRDYEAMEEAIPLNMFQHIYREIPWTLQEQMEEVRELHQIGGVQ